MIDTLLANLEVARGADVCGQFGVPPGRFALLTLHRPSNVDDTDRLRSILRAVSELSRRMPVLFPIHPRTAAKISQFGLDGDPLFNGYRRLEPIGYRETVGLMDQARLVLTDSGGMQEETTVLHVPCLTLRENTERPVTVSQGSNRLVGWRTYDILSAVDAVLTGPHRIGDPPKYWDGQTSRRIAELLTSDLAVHGK
jgi:UDP-N-acetylglucosamine 2-epimerase (non-hydrolysing)